MTERAYKYIKEDFTDFPATLKHLDIYLNFIDDRVEVENRLQIIANRDIEELRLDADELKLISIERFPDAAFNDEDAQDIGYDYDEKNNRIMISLDGTIKKGDIVYMKTITHCFPSDTILEGIYKDVTPEGAPQQYISQCEQWGFQRIMPVIDDCRAKCTMRTTIEADARYTHLISNGNIDAMTNPQATPMLKNDDPKRKVITYVNDIPMSPYLFIVAVGTWDMLKSSVEYDDGREVNLEYLVPPERKADARIPMEILKRSVLWIKETQGYEYAHDTYRTICMTRSNFGGMENVGNTTIVTDAALIDEHTLDSLLSYAHKVIVHEFEHNQCGSETTMETPFDMWLNEGFTVDVERQFSAGIFDVASVRLEQVSSIRDPLLGPLAIEDSGIAGRISRVGFNHPDELVDGVTYVKSAEVIRMMRLILGADDFRAAKTLYFERYKDSNANTAQFFECFEEVSGISLERFRDGWINTQGYPRVSVETEYDAKDRTYRMIFRQESPASAGLFHIPIELAIVGKDGKDIEGTSQVFHFDKEEAELVIKGMEEAPLLPSLNRDYSFYGRFDHINVTREELIAQATLDPNLFNRAEAMKILTDTERIRLLEDPEAKISDIWLDLFGRTLADKGISNALKASMLSISETSLRKEYCAWYRELVAARERLMKAVNSRYNAELKSAFKMLDTYSSPASMEKGIEDRSLKTVLLGLIAIEDSGESHNIIIDHYRNATTANDRVTALVFLNRSSSPERKKMLEEAYEEWKNHLTGYSNYLRVISGGTNEEVFDDIKAEKKKPGFDIKLPIHSRALIFPMAFNTKMVWTDKGMAWVKDTVIEFSAINTTLASRLLNVFQHVDRLKDDIRPKVVEHLKEIAEAISPEDNPTVHGQTAAYLDKVKEA